MIVTLGIVTTLLGTILAIGAPRMPTYRTRLESCGGGLFVSGLFLLATTFPMI